MSDDTSNEAGNVVLVSSSDRWVVSHFAALGGGAAGSRLKSEAGFFEEGAGRF